MPPGELIKADHQRPNDEGVISTFIRCIESNAYQDECIKILSHVLQPMPKIVRQDHVSHHKNAAQQYLLQYFRDPEALQLRDQP